MRVLLSADTVGGVWTWAVTLCRALARCDVDIALATMGAPLTAEQRSAVRGCRRVTLYEGRHRLEWMPDPWQDVAAAGDWLLGIGDDFQPHVVHLNGYAHGALPWRRPLIVTGHSCVLSWWRAVHGCDAPAEWDRYRAAAAAGLRAAAVVTAPTAAMRDALVLHYGPLAQTRVIHNGGEGGGPPLGARDAVGGYPGSPELPEPLVLAAGRVWDESKNFATLAAAAPAIRWPVHVAGSDTGPDGRRPLDGVHCLGALSAGPMMAWHRRASIFVHPALYEPFGLAPLEAASTGSALVLGDIPSLREVWGDAAVYVPPRDAGALADAVNALIAEPPRLAAMAQAAQRRAAHFTARRMADAYHELYLHAARLPVRAAQEAPACA